MHAAQNNEFVGAYGHHHILSPIGYGRMMKTVIRGTPTRSAAEQHSIHTNATQFLSHVIRIPAVYQLVNRNTYIMEHMPCGHFVNPIQYKCDMRLLCALNEFFRYMLREGYFPYNFTLLANEDGTYTLLDFSQFGDYQDGLVKLKHLTHPITLLEAEKAYGIMSFLCVDEFIEFPTKIEVCAPEESDNGAVIQ
jgi:hypothetical protein